MVIVESLTRNELDGQKSYCYYYRLIKNKLCLPCEGEALEVQSYGIEIERQDIVNDAVVGIDRESIDNVSPHRYKVHNLLKVLFDNSVSPLHLVDIAGDYVDEYAEDFDEALKEIATN